MTDQITFDHEVEGLAHPVTVTAEFEPPDYSVGISGGWFLVEAYLKRANRTLFKLDREDFEFVFGTTALRVAEEAVADIAMDRQADASERVAEAAYEGEW